MMTSNIWLKSCQAHHHHLIIYPLTVRVIEASQMISQSVCSIFPLFCTALLDSANSRPVHSLMLSSHLFLCLPCLLPLFTVPYKMVLVRPDEWETWPYHCRWCLFTMVRRSSCGLIVCRILARTSSLITWSLYEMLSIFRWHLISMVCTLLWSSAVRVHNSQAYSKMDVTRERISQILKLREILLSFQTGFNLVNYHSKLVSTLSSTDSSASPTTIYSLL